MSYADDLKHPRWQERRLRVLEAAGFRCARCGCGDLTLHAHHKLYVKGRRPWEYEDELLECLCDPCHDAAHAEKEALEYLVAQQPTASLPSLTDAVAAALAGHGANPSLRPRAREVYRKLGAALASGNPTELIDANNAVQDLIDEMRDFERGPGGSTRTEAP